MIKHEVVCPSFNSPCGRYHVNVNFDNSGDITAVNIETGKNGSCRSVQAEKLSSIINLALKFGCPIAKIVKVLKNEHNKYDEDGNCTHSICCDKPNCHEEIGRHIEECIIDKKEDK